MRIPFLSLCALALLSSCATAQKNYQYMSEPEYQAKPELTQSLISPNEPLNETAVQKILASKVVLPKKLNLAIVRLADSGDFQTIDQEIAEQFYKSPSWSGRVQLLLDIEIDAPVLRPGLVKHFTLKV